MKYQVGDKIIVLHSNEEGEVIDIINDKMVMIDVRGVKFPAYMDQIDFPYFKRFTEKKLFPEKRQKKYVEDVRKEKAVPRERIADGAWLSFLPQFATDEFGDDVVTELKIHLLNRTDRAYNFTYNLHFFGKSEFEIRNEMAAFSDFYLHDIPFEDINDSPSFNFEFSLLLPDKTKADYHKSRKVHEYTHPEKLRRTCPGPYGSLCSLSKTSMRRNIIHGEPVGNMKTRLVEKTCKIFAP